MKIKHLITSAMLAAAAFFAAPSAQAFTTPWLPCGFKKPHMTELKVMKCRMLEITESVVRVEWLDGASDVFTYLGDSQYIDSRGGYWLADSGVHEGYNYLLMRSLSTGTEIFMLAD